MDIRVLQEQEITTASDLAVYVYEKCVRPLGVQPEMNQAFYEYSSAEALTELSRAGRLVLWGAFQNGQMYAMSAMQTEGHITMLYVLPQFMNRGTATALLDTMGKYACEIGGLNGITVNAMPTWSEGFFARHGYTRSVQVPQNAPFVPMAGKLRREVVYEKRPFPAGAAMVLGILLLVGSFALVLGYLLLR